MARLSGAYFTLPNCGKKNHLVKAFRYRIAGKLILKQPFLYKERRRYEKR